MLENVMMFFREGVAFMSQDRNISLIGIVKSAEGSLIVQIKTIVFPGKRKIDWNSVEEYLKILVGDCYVIEETGETVYISSDFPDEFAHSGYNKKAFGAIGKAKANCAQAIPELITTVSHITYRPNYEEKHKFDAAGGWKYGMIHFTLPIMDDKGNIIGENNYKGRMVMRCDAQNKMHLYDIVNIKKET